MLRPISVLVLAISLLASACGTPTTPEGVALDPQATTLPDAGAEVPDSEPTDLAQSSSADVGKPPIANEATLSYAEIAEKLESASADGASAPALVFSDDFSSPGWSEFSRDDFATNYADGAYELSIMPGGFSTAFGINPGIGPLEDFYFQIETRAYGPADNGYGIRFREQEGGFYEFTISSGGTDSNGEPISSGGTFSVDKFAEGSMENKVPFKSVAPSIVQGDGELNVLGVLALGSDISIYINGQEVASFSDLDHAAGGISLRVSPYFEEGSRTLFDNAGIWVPAN